MYRHVALIQMRVHHFSLIAGGIDIDALQILFRDQDVDRRALRSVVLLGNV